LQLRLSDGKNVKKANKNRPTLRRAVFVFGNSKTIKNFLKITSIYKNAIAFL